ncbi:polyketide synthase [Romeria aff. gracilis LEGE 07310]|uniref:Polyketide synthase n=1 Tax=Vasconcelosia minhoensis LEGE 07310 TaxID=915328 RepID=A0A8J7AXA9_9CYAN|nr:polyketide synthase [Romeria gracilis]MBE9080529.1 polyketide synthase [Romeria aff. gracilis LEGE 07310]
MSLPPDPEASPTQRALQAVRQLKARVAELERSQAEPIAIIGMGCRFPGGAENPERYWQLLQKGKDAITEIPPDRWDVAEYYSPDPGAAGKMISRHGGFVPDPYGFDAPFFRLAPREALCLDPQQRLFLEVSWEALEQAGVAAERLQGEATSVFVGICSVDYWQRLLAQPASDGDAYVTTGNTHSVTAGRLSYLLGVTGPSIALDAACASSLVAVHLACQSLRLGECHLAIAGGVNRIITPDASIHFSKARMLSPEGRCRTFDAAANGFVRGEGGGAVVLKRLSQAEADGDPILALLLGSAVNHNGRTSSLTAPNGPAQQAVIRQALAVGQIDPTAVSYVETHGTGTALGDPIELAALGQVFVKRSAADPLALGAGKTNIGHLEAAAGIAGLIKTVLALQHRELPANLHLKTPNPDVDWARLPLQPLTQSQSWTADRRIAGVSAFGFNGSNAHVVVAEPPSPPPSRLGQGPYLLALSARTDAALKQLVQRYESHLTTHPDLSLGDICYTAIAGRCHFNHRLAMIADSLPELLHTCRAFLQDQPAANWVQGRAEPTGSKTIPISTRDGMLTAEQTPLAGPDGLNQLARLYVQGANLEWTNRAHRKVPLPTYPFQRQQYGLGALTQRSGMKS